MTASGTPPARRIAATLGLLTLLAASPVPWAPAARAMVGDSPTPQEAPVTQTWFVRVSPAAQAADRAYLAGMRPHHEGALTMAQEYLADRGASSPLLKALAGTILTNQEFEIGVLDEVARNLDQPPLRLPFGIALQPAASAGLADRLRFFKAPVPSPLGHPIAPVSERDVVFAKGMILHHEGALTMARDYHADPVARNGFLHLMNTDILTDQAQEIALMRLVIAAFPGDAARIVVDPATIPGMEGMGHGHGAHRH